MSEPQKEKREPLTPADCDLRDFQFIQIDVRRLLTSETWITGTADEKCAAMTLWLESWHQVPAASIPTNDKMLAHLSGAGSKWPKVKAQALRGWKDGGDGRLYHPVVAEKALEAWIEKLSAAISGNNGNAKRWQIEIDNSQLQASLREAVEQLKIIAPRSKTLNKKTAKIIESQSPPDSGMESPPDSGCYRNRQGQGQGLNKKKKACAESFDPPVEPEPLPEPDYAKPTARTPHDSRVMFEITADWQPTNTIGALLIRAGFDPDHTKIDPSRLTDFVTHWIGSPERKTQDGWHGQLVGWLKRRQHEKPAKLAVVKSMNAKGSPDKNSPDYDPHQDPDGMIYPIFKTEPEPPRKTGIELEAMKITGARVMAGDDSADYETILAELKIQRAAS